MLKTPDEYRNGGVAGGRWGKNEKPDRRRGDLGKRSGADTFLLCAVALKIKQ
jgi:hypothetical protein